MKINIDNCISCGQCEEVCPVNAIIPVESNGYSRYKIDELTCLDCGECLKIDCPGDAIHEN